METNFKYNLILKYKEMKKMYVFFTAIFLVVAFYGFAQDSQKSFIIKEEKNSIDGKTYLYYLDPASNEHYPAPKDGKGQYVKSVNMEINSIEKLKFSLYENFFDLIIIDNNLLRGYCRGLACLCHYLFVHRVHPME